MRSWSEVRRLLDTGLLDNHLERLMYGTVKGARARTADVLEGFQQCFGTRQNTPIMLCSAPGRTEICGNHTDHQHGHVLAAAVNVDFLACAALNGTNCVRFQSVGWPLTIVSLDDLKAQDTERETTAALIRGMMAQAAEKGYPVKGVDIYAASDVLPGSGLSSSAACEVLLGVAINHLFCHDELTPVTIAQMAQRAENDYFGKPCGLMDQMASSVGGAVSIDFADPVSPVVSPISVDLRGMGLALCIIESGADHAALTNEYAAIPQEMGSVAAFFGKNILREVTESDVIQALPALRKAVGDRAVLRALHYYADDRRAILEAGALAAGNTAAFLELVRQSGRSSWELLQNITPVGATRSQDMAVALTAAEIALAGRGACRVHGGGFAGTIQAFVPLDGLSAFRERITAALGSNCCHVMSIRPVGGTVLLP